MLKFIKRNNHIKIYYYLLEFCYLLFKYKDLHPIYSYYCFVLNSLLIGENSLVFSMSLFLFFILYDLYPFLFL